MTLVQKEIKKVYLGTNQVRPVQELPYTPTANTIAYFPFQENQLDVMENYSLTNSWTKESLWFSFSTITNFVYSQPLEYERFFGFWAKPSSSTTWALWFSNLWWMRFNWNVNNIKEFTMKDSWGTFHGGSISWTWTTNIRYYIAFTINTSNQYKWWVNGVQKWSGTYAPATYTGSSVFGADGSGGATTFSDFIVERAAWTADQVTAYFNKTKSTYWL